MKGKRTSRKYIMDIDHRTRVAIRNEQEIQFDRPTIHQSPSLRAIRLNDDY